MKNSKVTTVLLVLLILGLIASAFLAFGPSRFNRSGMSQNWAGGPFCPFCGRGGYGSGTGGPGMMGPGSGWGQGMMGSGFGHHWGMGQGYPPNQAWNGGSGQARKMNKADIEALLRYRLGLRGNPNLKVGQITDAGDYFEAAIVTKDDSLVEKYRINKSTGWMQPAN